MSTIDQEITAMTPSPTPFPFEPYQVLLANGALFEVRGVYLGGENQTDAIGLRSLSETPNCHELCVPQHILEAAFLGGMKLIDHVIRRAVERFDNENDGVFNTACFQTALNGKPSSREAEAILLKHPRVIHLYGGSHWMLLPNGLRKHEEAGK